ncbi:MAG: TauD/TfdA family dioxygenase [Caulobacteraceae bacterium]
MYDVSNLDRDGNVIQQGGPVYKANAVFHTDSSFNDLPTKWSLLSGRQVPPEGGETQFIDTRAVWDQLPQAMKARAQGAVALHNFWKSRSEAGMSNITDEMRRAMPPARQPMVRTSASGRTALVIGSHAESIEGWPDDQARAFLREINAFAAQPPFVYTHRWRNGDLVIWDNRCTLHRAPEFSSKYVRDMRRTTINESGPEAGLDRSVPGARRRRSGRRRGSLVDCRAKIVLL